MHAIPHAGRIDLVDGDLIARTDAGVEVGRFFVGPNGLVYRGELTLWQDEDPPKLRFASSYRTWRGFLGAFSFNLVRPDGRQEEIAYCGGGLAEDAQPGELRGQLQVNVRGDGDPEPRVQCVISDAYTLSEFGTRFMQILVRSMMPNLWKWR